MNNLFVQKIESISPQYFRQYLESNHWQQEKEVPNFASVWTYKADDELYALLLPLNPDFVDFLDRLSEAIDVLEKIEQRSKDEILSDIKKLSVISDKVEQSSKDEILSDARHSSEISSSEISDEIEREILKIKVSASDDKDKREVHAKKMGLVFKSLQDLLDVFGNFKPSRYDNLQQTKPKLQLSILGTFTGSFGVKVAFPSNQQLDIYGNTIAQEVSQEFFELMKASNEKNITRFKEMLSEYKGDPSKKIKSFFSNLARLESDFDFDWDAIDPENSDRASVDYAHILRAIDVISKIEQEQPIQFKVIGRLIVAGEGTNKKERRFLLKDTEDETIYEGIIDYKIIDDESIDLIIGKVYEATLEEETFIQEATQTEIKKYTLMGLELRTV